MSESMLGLGGNKYIRVVLKTVQAFPGIGVTRLMFTFELSNRDVNSTGFPLWLGGRAEVQITGGSRPYVGPLQPSTSQPINIGPAGTEAGAQLTLDLTDHQLWLIDDNRISDAVHMFLTLTGYAIIDGQHVSIQEAPLNHQMNQSEWLEIVQQAGLRRVLLLELEVPDPQLHPELSRTLNFFAQAQSRYHEGEWRQAIECVRQSLAALVGKEPEEEDQESDVADAIKSAYKESQTGRLGYEPRRELVRRAAKFMADLGAHPEVAESRKPDAYAALMIAGGLLHAFSVKQN